MMNLGGPSTTADVRPFLSQLFADHEIIKLPLQPILSRLIVAMRTPKVIKLYQSIGGGSPIGKWTNLQGTASSRW
jgi:ferrochelatase